MSDEARAALAQLSELWRRERDAAREAFRQERKLLDFRERVERGLALADLTLDDVDSAAGGRVLLWVKLGQGTVLADTRIGTGDPVLLWAGDPEGERREQG